MVNYLVTKFQSFLYLWVTNNYIRFFKFLFFSIIIFLSLYSHNGYDNSLNVASNLPASNIFGKYGALFSDVILQTFGITSFFIPFALLCWGLQIIFLKKISRLRLRVISLIISLCILSFVTTSFSSLGSVGVIISKAFPLAIYKYMALIIFILFAPFALGFSISLPIATHEETEESIVIENEPIQSKPKITPSPQLFDSITQEQENYVQKSPNISKDNFKGNFKDGMLLPGLDLLMDHQGKNVVPETKTELDNKAQELLKTLQDFGVKGNIISINQGPVVTLYEFEPNAGTKSSRVIGLADDIARSMSALSTRISIVPGRNVLGIELPNKNRQFFCLKELIKTPEYQNTQFSLPLILGKDLNGKPYIADLAKMPHLLIAGTTGSGKSVGINTMIISLLYRYKPSECKMIMIDPKMLELSIYDNIPHLLTPVVTDPAKAVIALKWAVKEMETRYKLMSQMGVRNIGGYNQKIQDAMGSGKELYSNVQVGFDQQSGAPIYEKSAIEMKKMPFIVVIVDEMADLMLVAGKDIESLIQRLAQMARAAGIHLIMATQRPSVDVITGVIKANFPSRVSFKVTSKIDSRTILGEQGAEQLLGMGDMLYIGNGSNIERVHGPFVDDKEVEKIVEFLKQQGPPEYVTSVVESIQEEEDYGDDKDETSDEGLYKQAVQIVKRDKKPSISYIQRSLRIGYNRAAILIERMEKEGVVSAPNHSNKREILEE